MLYYVQFIKYLMSGDNLKGINFRTILSIILSFSVLIIEIVIFYMNWDSVPDMMNYDYDLDGNPNGVCEKIWVCYNILIQIFIMCFVFVIKQLSYKIKCIHQIVFDENNQIIPIMNKRFSMFAWEFSMLYITTEQGYIFAISGIIGDTTCDYIVALILLFWQIIMIIEFRSDIKKLTKQIKEKCLLKEINNKNLFE